MSYYIEVLAVTCRSRMGVPASKHGSWDCNRRLYVSAHNNCKRVLNYAKSLLVEREMRHIASHEFGSARY